MSIEDAWKELDEFLTGEDVYPAPSGDTDALTLEGSIDAARAGRALAALQRDEDEIAAVIQAERDRLAAFEADRMSGIARRREWLTAGLESFAREEKARRGVATIKLPSVTLRVKKAVPRIDGTLTDGLLSGYPEVIRHRPAELDKAAAKKAFTPGPKIESGPTHDVHTAVDGDGVVVEGVTFQVPRFDSFTWELRTATEADPEAER